MAAHACPGACAAVSACVEADSHAEASVPQSVLSSQCWLQRRTKPFLVGMAVQSRDSHSVKSLQASPMTLPPRLGKQTPSMVVSPSQMAALQSRTSSRTPQWLGPVQITALSLTLPGMQ